MSDVLQINMLGEFTIQYGSSLISEKTNRSKKVWTLLEYLLAFRNRDISQDELIELLWPDDEIADPANTLKTLLHRTRAMLSKLQMPEAKNLIIVSNGSCAWNLAIPCVIDIDRFEVLCTKAYSPQLDDNNRIDAFMEALAFYKGGFLAKNAVDLWIVPMNTYYLSKYTKAVLDVCKLLILQNRFEEIVRLCEKAVLIDPYEEQFHFYYIWGLSKSEKRSQALTHYHYVNQLFFDKFGITPSDELQQLYKEISKSEKSVQLDLTVINTHLQEQDKPEGCFYCEFELFKNIYRLMSRTCARTGEVIYLCLFTVESGKKETNPDHLSNTVAALKNTIQDSLRISDTYTRYSPSQYLVMLPCVSYEGATIVSKRIVNHFYTTNPKCTAVVQYRIQPIAALDRLQKSVSQ